MLDCGCEEGSLRLNVTFMVVAVYLHFVEALLTGSNRRIQLRRRCSTGHQPRSTCIQDFSGNAREIPWCILGR